MANFAQRKGKGYERHIAKVLSKGLDCDVRRVPCSGALDIKGDLRNLSGPLAEWVFECKKQEKIGIWKCIAQAISQAGYKKWALIFSRNNEGADYVVMDLNDFIEIQQKLKELKEN